MTEEEGKQEMPEAIQIQIHSPDQDEGCQAEEELELENDFFGLNGINEKDNVKVKVHDLTDKYVLKVIPGLESWNKF